ETTVHAKTANERITRWQAQDVRSEELQFRERDTERRIPRRERRGSVEWAGHVAMRNERHVHVEPQRATAPCAELVLPIDDRGAGAHASTAIQTRVDGNLPGEGPLLNVTIQQCE